MNPTIAGRQRDGGFKSSPQKSIISHHHTFRDMNSGPPSARKIYCSNTSLLGLAPSMIFLSKHAAWISSSLNSNFGSNRNRQQCKAISRYAMMTGNPYLFHMNSIVVYNYYIQCMTHHNARKYPTNNSTYLDMDTISSGQRVDYI